MPKVTVMRGLPGAGKSDYLKAATDALIISQAKELVGVRKEHWPMHWGTASNACLRAFVEALQAGVPHVAVDRPNIGIAEFAPYCSLALAYGYELEVVTLEMSPSMAAARCPHQDSAEYVAKLVRRLDEATRDMPPYWPLREIQRD